MFALTTTEWLWSVISITVCIIYVKGTWVRRGAGEYAIYVEGQMMMVNGDACDAEKPPYEIGTVDN